MFILNIIIGSIFIQCIISNKKMHSNEENSGLLHTQKIENRSSDYSIDIEKNNIFIPKISIDSRYIKYGILENLLKELKVTYDNNDMGGYHEIVWRRKPVPQITFYDSRFIKYGNEEKIVKELVDNLNKNIKIDKNIFDILLRLCSENIKGQVKFLDSVLQKYNNYIDVNLIEIIISYLYHEDIIKKDKKMAINGIINTIFFKYYLPQTYFEKGVITIFSYHYKSRFKTLNVIIEEDVYRHNLNIKINHYLNLFPIIKHKYDVSWSFSPVNSKILNKKEFKKEAYLFYKNIYNNKKIFRRPYISCGYIIHKFLVSILIFPVIEPKINQDDEDRYYFLSCEDDHFCKFCRKINISKLKKRYIIQSIILFFLYLVLFASYIKLIFKSFFLWLILGCLFLVHCYVIYKRFLSLISPKTFKKEVEKILKNC